MNHKLTMLSADKILRRVLDLKLKYARDHYGREPDSIDMSRFAFETLRYADQCQTDVRIRGGISPRVSNGFCVYGMHIYTLNVKYSRMRVFESDRREKQQEEDHRRLITQQMYGCALVEHLDEEEIKKNEALY